MSYLLKITAHKFDKYASETAEWIHFVATHVTELAAWDILL
jgi:hypothetical protein